MFRQSSCGSRRAGEHPQHLPYAGGATVKISFALTLILACVPFAWADGTLVYFGAYTGTGPGQSKGIYFSRFDAAKADAPDPELAVETDSPSYLALHPNHRFVYAVNESGATGAVSSFAIDPATSKLTLLNKVNSGGSGPCYLAVDKTGKYLMVANFTAGNASVLRIKDDGSLGEQTALVQHTGSSINPAWQQGPRAHWVGFSPDNRFAIVVNLGNEPGLRLPFRRGKGFAHAEPRCDREDESRLRTAQFDVPSQRQIRLPPQSAQRSSDCVRVGRGAWELSSRFRKRPYCPQAHADFNSAKVLVEPNGRFLYTSTRGSDTIGVFSIDPAKGNVDAHPTGTLARHVSARLFTRPDRYEYIGCESIFRLCEHPEASTARRGGSEDAQSIES